MAHIYALDRAVTVRNLVTISCYLINHFHKSLSKKKIETAHGLMASLVARTPRRHGLGVGAESATRQISI